ncbi:MAG: response regulator [Motiliproteus sp.]
MTIQLLICDDSGLARKQLARSLPDGLDAEITFATHGLEAMEVIRTRPIDLMFLDLTMPVMDGYEVLEAIQQENHQLDVVVVSGDIQIKAQNRVKALGARDFLKKPCSTELLEDLLPTIGYPLTEYDIESPKEILLVEKTVETAADIDPIERISEVANVAMGRAASLLADLLGVFVVLPLPMVNEVEPSELQMTISAIGNDDAVSAVCQGFIGSGISGEALLILHDTSIDDIAKLMRQQDSNVEENHLEILMDLANILISASLKGIEEQLDIRFSQDHPSVLGEQESIDKLLARGQQQWQKTLAIEYDYRIEEHDIQCTLMLLFSENAIPVLHRRTAYLG